MKFLVDAQLPPQLKRFLQSKNFDVIHTEDLPDKEFSSDNFIREIANSDLRILITKDEDFVDTCLLKNSPAKLLWVTTGNIVNAKLIELFEKNIDFIVEGFKKHRFIEMNNQNIFFHE